MGYGAGPDPASARPKPGALLGRHRNHAAELREVDAFYGGAGSGFLADPAICLSASLRALHNPEAAVLFKSRERKLSSPERRGTAPRGRSECSRKQTFSCTRAKSAMTDTR